MENKRISESESVDSAPSSFPVFELRKTAKAVAFVDAILLLVAVIFYLFALVSFFGNKFNLCNLLNDRDLRDQGMIILLLGALLLLHSTAVFALLRATSDYFGRSIPSRLNHSKFWLVYTVALLSVLCAATIIFMKMVFAIIFFVRLIFLEIVWTYKNELKDLIQQTKPTSISSTTTTSSSTTTSAPSMVV